MAILLAPHKFVDHSDVCVRANSVSTCTLDDIIVVILPMENMIIWMIALACVSLYTRAHLQPLHDIALYGFENDLVWEVV